MVQEQRRTKKGTQRRYEDVFLLHIESTLDHSLTSFQPKKRKEMRNIIGWILIIDSLIFLCAVSFGKAQDTTIVSAENSKRNEEESFTSSNHVLIIANDESIQNSTDGGGDSNATSVPSSSSNGTTHVPSISPAPTLIGNKNITTSAPTVAPQPSSTGTSKPTRQYTHGPTLSPTSTSTPTTQEQKNTPKRSIWRTLFTFMSWVFITLVSLLVCGKCMSHRSQIYFWFMEMWYNLSNRVEHLNVGERLSNAWAFVKGISLGLYRRITRRNVAPSGVMDEDGSTMMQGLLMRENM